MERNGLITREVLATSPVAVEYAITELGRTLQVPFGAVYRCRSCLTRSPCRSAPCARPVFAVARSRARRAPTGDICVATTTRPGQAPAPVWR
nr:winged helix-turn-helix transcriptional regulator [Luteibacter anthropi]